MAKTYHRKAIDQNLINEINTMQDRIKEAFGINVNQLQASKVIAWKSKSYNAQLTPKKLLEILGGNDV